MLEERDGEGTNGMRKRRLLLEERGVGGGGGGVGGGGCFPSKDLFQIKYRIALDINDIQVLSAQIVLAFKKIIENRVIPSSWNLRAITEAISD